MKWLVELQDGSLIEVECTEFVKDVPEIHLEENEMALKKPNSSHFRGVLYFKTKEDKEKVKQSGVRINIPVGKPGVYIVVPIKKIGEIKGVEVVEV